MHTLFIILLVLSIIITIGITIKPGKNEKTGERYKRKDVFFGGLILVIIFGIVTGVTTPHHKPTVSAKTTANKTAQTTSNIATTSPTSKPSNQPSKPGLTGFGATHDEWNKTHTADPQATANSSYGPGGGTHDCSNFGDRYYGMINTSDYSMCFPSNQSLATTQAEVMQEFPGDTTILRQGKQTSGEPSECYQMEVHSATLASATSTDGNAFVEFETLDPSNSSGNIEYQPSNVNDASLVAEDNASLSAAPGC